MRRRAGHRIFKLAFAAAVMAAVAGCSSDDGVAPADTFAGQLLRGTAEPAQTPDPDSIKKIAVCPDVNIRSGTQTHLITNRAKKADKLKIFHQGTITRTARDCDTSTGNLVMEVGVAGRVLAGPDGKPGTVRLPVRVVALIPSIEGGETEVLYSKLHEVEVVMPEGDSSVAWAKIDNGINVKIDKRIKVYVGFDDGNDKKKKR